MSDREIPATSWAVWAWQAYRDGRLVEDDRIEELEAKLGEYNLLWQTYELDKVVAELKGQDDE